jgi:hypothetical protein
MGTPPAAPRKMDGEPNDAAVTGSAIEALDWRWPVAVAQKDSIRSIIERRAFSIGAMSRVAWARV